MSSEKFVHRLVLPSVRLSDVGEYTAVAGSSMSKGHLGVEGRDIKISEPPSRNTAVSHWDGVGGSHVMVLSSSPEAKLVCCSSETQPCVFVGC